MHLLFVQIDKKYGIAREVQFKHGIDGINVNNKERKIKTMENIKFVESKSDLEGLI